MGEEEECNVRKDTIWVIGTLAQSTLPRPSGRRGGRRCRCTLASHRYIRRRNTCGTRGVTHSERRLRLPALLAGEDWRALAGMRRMTLGGGCAGLGVPAPGVSAMLPSDNGSSLYETDADARVLGVSMSIGKEVGVSVESCWSRWDIGGG